MIQGMQLEKKKDVCWCCIFLLVLRSMFARDVALAAPQLEAWLAEAAAAVE